MNGKVRTAALLAVFALLLLPLTAGTAAAGRASGKLSQSPAGDGGCVNPRGTGLGAPPALCAARGPPELLLPVPGARRVLCGLRGVVRG